MGRFGRDLRGLCHLCIQTTLHSYHNKSLCQCGSAMLNQILKRRLLRAFSSADSTDAVALGGDAEPALGAAAPSGLVVDADPGGALSTAVIEGCAAAVALAAAVAALARHAPLSVHTLAEPEMARSEYGICWVSPQQHTSRSI